MLCYVITYQSSEINLNSSLVLILSYSNGFEKLLKIKLLLHYLEITLLMNKARFLQVDLSMDFLKNNQGLHGLGKTKSSHFRWTL